MERWRDDKQTKGRIWCLIFFTLPSSRSHTPSIKQEACLGENERTALILSGFQSPSPNSLQTWVQIIFETVQIVWAFVSACLECQVGKFCTFGTFPLCLEISSTAKVFNIFKIPVEPRSVAFSFCCPSASSTERWMGWDGGHLGSICLFPYILIKGWFSLDSGHQKQGVLALSLSLGRPRAIWCQFEDGIGNNSCQTLKYQYIKK